MPSSQQYSINESPTYTTLQNVTLSQTSDYFDSICGMNSLVSNNSIMFVDSSLEENLYLRIVEQPSDTFRYRYKSEKGSHGGIKGENSSRAKKSFPTVKLENCPPSWREKITIRVSLYRNELDAKLHVYELTGKYCFKGICEAKLDKDFMAVFPTIAISTRKKEEVYEILKQRKISDYESFEIPNDEVSLEAEVQEEMKTINLDSAKLCFEAFSVDDADTPLCQKVFSNPINNQKSAASGDLKIVRLSRCSGKCSGGDEMFLLCEKVKKEDIKVRFYEKPEDGVWEEYGEFNPAEVHHQVVIIVKTPKYYQSNVRRTVCIDLLRPSDGKFSEARQFEYIPDDDGILDATDRKMKEEMKYAYGKRKRPKLEENDQISEDYLKGSSIMDSPQSLEDEPDFLKEYGFSFEDLKLFADHSGDLIDDVVSKPNTSEKEEDYPTMDVLRLVPQCALIENPVFPDCLVDQISHSMDSLSLVDRTSDRKLQKVSKDFMEGMNTILQNRGANTYLRYASRLIPLEDENGNSMLHLAILEQNGNWNLIRKMLEMISEDSINHQNKFKETPLHLAIKGNHVEILLLLLLKGGDPNLVDCEGNNCLHLAAKYGHINCLTKLILPPERTRIFKCTINDINCLNYDGMSALHIAVSNNFEDCVDFLLKFKADVNLPEKKCGRTSLHLAVEHPALFQTLLNQPETDICAVDFGGYTADQLVCSKTEENENMNDEIIKNINQDSEAESDADSTDFSDFEDAVDEFISAPSVSTSELKEEKSSLMKTEEELCKYLDMNDNWKILADLIGLNAQYVAMFDKNPGQMVLKKIKDLNHPCDINAIIGILNLAGLEEGVQILQKHS